LSVNQRVLSGRYELSDPLGSGGMAEVFLGRDRVLGRTIAVKTLLAHFSGDPQFLARFRREAQSAAALNHPNIVGVYDTGSDDGTHYIVMEYIEGRTLRDIIREEGPLLPERAAEIAGDVCAALAFAHSHGIVHRDIKPANVMMTKTGEVKVTDFGIARAASSETVTQTATVLGTAQYFSPEQAQAGNVDARSDIYSLGVVLYEMLTRQVPFTGSSPVVIAYKHVKEDPVLPSRLNADVPPALESIVMKALAKNPDNRYQTAQEMRQDLMRAATGKPVHATPLMADTSIVAPGASDATVMMKRPVAVEQAKRRRTAGWIILTLIMLAIAGVVAWAIISSLNKAPVPVKVPNVVGLKVDEAKRILQARGLVPDVVPTPSDTVAAGLVIDQTPPRDTQLHKGDRVQLTVSTGKGTAVVPDLKGLTKEAAIKRLQDAGLMDGVITERASSEADKGKVIAQSIPKGTGVTRGTKVDFTIGKGPETAVVPNVSGLSETDARASLASAGFTNVTVLHSSDGACASMPDRVCQQSPPANSVAQKNAPVTITLGQVPTETPTPTPT